MIIVSWDSGWRKTFFLFKPQILFASDDAKIRSVLSSNSLKIEKLTTGFRVEKDVSGRFSTPMPHYIMQKYIN